MTDIRARALAGETLLGVFLDLGSPLSAEMLRPGRLRLGAHRPRARRRHRGEPAGPPARRRGHAGRRARPPAVRRAAAHRPRARPRRRRRHGPAARHGRPGPRGGRLPALPAGRRPRGRAAAPAAPGWARAATTRSARSTSGRSASSRSSPRRPSPRSTTSRRSTASTSSSSARPTCRTRWASPGSSPTRATSPRSTRVVAACAPARQVGRDPALRPRRDRPARRARVPVHRPRRRTASFVANGREGDARAPRVAADRHSSATRTSGIGRPAAPRPGLGDDHAHDDQRRRRPAGPGVSAIPKSRRRQRDRVERLDRADERGLRRADPPGARVERLDRDERRDDADARRGRPTPADGICAGRTGRPLSEAPAPVHRRGRGHHQRAWRSPAVGPDIVRLAERCRAARPRTWPRARSRPSR